MPNKKTTSNRSQNARVQGKSTRSNSPETVNNEVKKNKTRVARSDTSTEAKSQNAIEQIEKPALIELEERKAELTYSPQAPTASKKKKISQSGTKAAEQPNTDENSAKSDKKSECSCCCGGTFGKALLTLIVVLICCTIAVSYVKRYRTITTENNSIGDSSLSVFTIFDDIKIKICNDEFSHDTMRSHSYENGTAALLKKLVVPGDTVIEVDQNIGAQSMLTAKLIGQGGRIYYFNPYRKYVEALQESAVLNDFQNRIFVYPLAISDQNSEGQLIYKNNFPIMSGRVCKKTEKVETGYSTMAINISSLDEQLPNLQNINLLKINVNGNEADVLRGALNLIRKSDNINIICSYNHDNFGSFALLESFLMDGFLIYLIDSEGGATRISLSELQKMQKCDILLRRYIPEQTVL